MSGQTRPACENVLDGIVENMPEGEHASDIRGGMTIEYAGLVE